MARGKHPRLAAYEAAEASYAAEAEGVCETPSARCYGAAGWMRRGLSLRFICAQCAHDWQGGANTPREASCEGYTSAEGTLCDSTTRLGVILSGVYCAGCRESVAEADAWHAEGACAGCPIHQHPYEY